MINKMKMFLITLILIFSFTGCTAAQSSNENAETGQTTVSSTESEADTSDTTSNDNSQSENTTSQTTSVSLLSYEGSVLDTADMFTERDLSQSADLSEAVSIKLENNQNVTIDTEGIYILSGEVSNVTVIVAADAEAKVQLVLDGVSITNDSAPAIYVKTADKVFVTSTDSENNMEVSGTFTSDGDTNTDAVIFSKADMILNGIGILEIVSKEGNGITSKDELKITGGVYQITAAADGMEANDSILIYDGDFTIISGKDALHSENEEDTTLGYIYIMKGTFQITATDDAIQGNTTVQIDGGTIKVDTCTEGIESTYIQLNGGEIDIYATDDGINATNKSNNEIAIEVNGGSIHVSMGSGDTDGFDTNGSICVNGGTIQVEAESSFDYDGTAELNGGTVIVNGSEVTELPQSMMGGGGGMRRR